MTIDQDKAMRYCRTASNIAFVWGGFVALTATLGLFGLQHHPDLERFAAALDPYRFFDAAIILSLGFFTRRKNRFAASLLFAFYVVTVLYEVLQAEMPIPNLVNLVVVFFLGRGVLGAFRWHRAQKHADPTYRAGGRLGAIGGYAAAVALAAVLAIGIWFSGAGALPTKVVFSEEIDTGLREDIASLVRLEEDEEIVLFYSTAFHDLTYDGNLVTDQSVIAWEFFEGEQYFYEMKIEDVRTIEIVSLGGPLSDTVLGVFDDRDEGFMLLFSAEAGGDTEVIRHLEEVTGLTAVDATEKYSSLKPSKIRQNNLDIPSIGRLGVFCPRDPGGAGGGQ